MVNGGYLEQYFRNIFTEYFLFQTVYRIQNYKASYPFLRHPINR